jgi:hypothetical protein
MTWPVPPDLASRKCVLLARSHSFHVLNCPFRYGLQEVCAPCSVAFFPCSNLSLPMWSPVCECRSLSRILSVYWPVSWVTSAKPKRPREVPSSGF